MKDFTKQIKKYYSEMYFLYDELHKTNKRVKVENKREYSNQIYSFLIKNKTSKKSWKQFLEFRKIPNLTKHFYFLKSKH